MAGFRLHPIEDADIIRDLERYKNKTGRLKEVYRKAMQLEKGAIKLSLEAPKIPEPWVLPEEPTVKVEHTILIILKKKEGDCIQLFRAFYYRFRSWISYSSKSFNVFLYSFWKSIT